MFKPIVSNEGAVLLADAVLYQDPVKLTSDIVKIVAKVDPLISVRPISDLRFEITRDHKVLYHVGVTTAHYEGKPLLEILEGYKRPDHDKAEIARRETTMSALLDYAKAQTSEIESSNKPAGL